MSPGGGAGWGGRARLGRDLCRDKREAMAKALQVRFGEETCRIFKQDLSTALRSGDMTASAPLADL